jgi:hypothetical protein
MQGRGREVAHVRVGGGDQTRRFDSGVRVRMETISGPSRVAAKQGRLLSGAPKICAFHSPRFDKSL